MQHNYEYVCCGSGSSDVWKNFKHVLVDELQSDYVACLSCWRVITYKKKDGTKGMHSHKCTESEKKPTQQKISAFVDRRSVPQHAADHLKTELVKFLAKDIRPFSAVTGIGFQSFCQTLVNYGARYGQFDVTKALPDRTTIARHVPEVVTKAQNDVRQQLAKCEHIALTSDGWTDDYRKIAYVTVTAHFLDHEMNLKSCVLNTGSVEEKKTAQVLGNVVQQVAADFGVDLKKVTVVTDNAANMVAAFRDKCCRLSCFAHCLNLVVTDMLLIDNNDFQTMLTGCKSLVRHFKHTGLQQKLKKTLKQECPTRWNSTYAMLESILEQYEEVHEILNARKELRFLYAVDKDVLSAVVSFLIHFKSASEMACCDKKPTLHLVVPLHHRLLTSVCADRDDDHPVVSDLKAKGRTGLTTKVRLETRHDVAAFLNPCMKGLHFVPAARKKAALESVRKLMLEETDDQSPTDLAADDVTEVTHCRL